MGRFSAVVAVAVVAVAFATSYVFADGDATNGNRDHVAEDGGVCDFTVKDIDGKDVSLSRYKGDVLLIINVASKWGFTARTYSGLESLFQKYKDQGLHVLAFPANNFGGQEPGSDDTIKLFCREKQKTTFDLFAKVSVKGNDQCPLFKHLTEHPDHSGEIKWNFEKFLVDRTGTLIARFSTRTLPEDPKIITKLEAALAATSD